MSDYRCSECDSRYCGSVCLSNSEHHVYVTGFGYLLHADAMEIQKNWQDQGIPFGTSNDFRSPDFNGIRRIEWNGVTPLENPKGA
jgi:hypothetical protein